MNILDVGIIIVLLYNALTGLRRGLSRILFNILGLGLGTALGLIHYPSIAFLLEQSLYMPRPYSEFLGFGIILSVIFVISLTLGQLFEKILKLTFLGSFNALGGCLLGVVKGLFVCLPFLIPMTYFKSPILDTSHLAPYLLPLTRGLLKYINTSLLELPPEITSSLNTLFQQNTLL